jgi:hypothetical protein
MNITTKLFAITSFILFPLTVIGAPEQVVATTVCDLASNPEALNHKLVKLSGDVTHGYKLFTLNAACKPNLSSLWLTYGGLASPPSIFNPQQMEAPRSQQLVIEGIPTTLVDDALFKRFNKLISGMSDTPQARVTLIARYFAGHPQQIGEFKIWKGFGPLDCCTLLVIQKVVKVESNDHKQNSK